MRSDIGQFPGNYCARPHVFVHADKMADRRKRVASSSHGKTPASEKKAKRQVGMSTCEKWQREFDREYQSLLWLRCDKDEANRSLVATLYCKVCRQFEDRIRGMCNFSSAWVTGTTNHRTSNVLDHAKSDQHIASMSRLREERAKAQNAPISSYAPIVMTDHVLALLNWPDIMAVRIQCVIISPVLYCIVLYYLFIIYYL